MADETTTVEAAPEPMPVGKAIPLIGAALVLVIGVTVLATVLGCDIWIVWLGMCLWASIGGMKIEIGEIVKAWLGGAIGITMGYLLTHNQEIGGTPVLIVAAVIVLCFIFGMVSHRFPYFSNNYTACFLTVCTAQGLPLVPLTAAKSLLFGFVVFGLVPLGVMKLMASRNGDEAKAA